MMETMDEYELLVRHTTAWATTKKRPLDAELLSDLLSLRDTHDRQPGTAWPAGSAEHLLTVRWPGHGPLGVPDDAQVAAMLDTLDTFWRFLRATGRMASGSAEPRDLLKEARRAAPEMVRRCGDSRSFGQAKGLQQFGREIGISLDEVDSIDELQQRLNMITEAWNALPMEERIARMPLPGGAGSQASRDLTDMFNSAMEELADHDDQDGELEDAIPVQDVAVVASQVRQSPFVRECLALAEWADGRQVTEAGFLRPAVAREAIEALQLGSWYADLFGLGERPWRSAGECLTIDRLWTPAVNAGLITVRGRTARLAATPRETDLEWVHLGLILFVELYRRIDASSIVASPLLGILLHLVHPDGEGSVTDTELVHWWRTTRANPFADPTYPHIQEHGAERIARLQELSDRFLRICLALFEGVGLWRRSEQWLHRTEFGLDATRVLIRHRELYEGFDDDLTDEDWEDDDQGPPRYW